MSQKIPDPIAIKTYAWHCDHCKTLICTAPQWRGDDGLGECDKCGATYLRCREGRPYGRRSRWWNVWLPEFREWMNAEVFSSSDTARKMILESVVMPKGWSLPTVENDPDLVVCEVDYVS